MVTASGVVRAVHALEAPLSGQPCVAHVTHARVFSQLDFLGVLLSELTVREAVEFMLETPSGALVVDATHCTVAAPVRRLLPEQSERMAAFLAPHGLSHLGGSTFAELQLIAPGDRVSIRGIAMRERAAGDGERGYRDEAERFKVVGYPQQPLEIVRHD